MNCNDHNHSEIFTKTFSSCTPICINNCNDNVCNIIESFCKIIIENCKIIKTCKGNSVAIKGKKIVKIHYASDTKCGAVQTCVFIDPFFELIPIECPFEINICNSMGNIDYFEIEKICNDDLYLYTILTLAVIIKKHPHCNKNNCDCFKPVMNCCPVCSDKDNWNIKNDEIDCN